MTERDALFELPPFGIEQPRKRELLEPIFQDLTRFHRRNCPAYAAMLDALPPDNGVDGLASIPFLPVGLFKQMTLRSGQDGTRMLHSSGTTGQHTAQIALDSETASLQRQALAAIAGNLLGPARLPMLILDTPDVLKPPLRFSARGAGVLGFSVCASRRVFALRTDMSLDVPALERFLERWGDQPFFLFGFTFLVWKHFYSALRQAGLRMDFSCGTLIHGGGWKSMQREAVSRDRFHAALAETCGLVRVHDYYGMAEQAGSIFPECECGHLHASLFSEVLVRRPQDFSLCKVGEEGILQVLSVLPHSYPGHSLLTEDGGILLGEDDCPCGRKGRYFTVTGRLPQAELRGCSDVYGAQFE
ncbi:MAG: acyl-protein synthetase [Intestinimonas sp.]|jgi:hypothetical protein|nr:acyl-protein synthetase [Intestinimonas sp.]